MRTVDVLTNARNVIENRANWTQHVLCKGHTFCAIGAIDVVSGILDPDANNITKSRVKNIHPSVIGGVHLFEDADGLMATELRHISSLSRAELKALAAQGAYPVQAEKAFRYLRAASFKLFNKTPVGVNDELGHEAVLAMFDKAIKNAKRRQINGKRYSDATLARFAEKKVTK